MQRGLAGVVLACVVAPAEGRADSFATLETASGDGGLTLTVDAYGAFGSGMANPGSFDPLDGPVVQTVSDSALFVRLPDLPGDRFLSTGYVDESYSGGRTAVDHTSHDATSATSTVTFQMLSFDVSQSLEEVYDGPTRIGALLDQDYVVTNDGTSLVNFDVVRYLDPQFEATSVQDGGGRLVVDEIEYLLVTDAAGDPATSTTVLAVSICGLGTPVTGRYEVDLPLGGTISNSEGALDDTIAGDGADGDALVDAGSGYDTSLAVGITYALGPGQSAAFSTETLFASMAPADVAFGCDLPNPQEPDSDGDGVPDDFDACPGFDDAEDADGDHVPDDCDPCPTDPADTCDDPPVDSDGDGVPDPSDACPGYDDTPDFDEDVDGDGLNDACDPCPLGDCASTELPPESVCTYMLPSNGFTIVRPGREDLVPVLDSTCYECLPDGTSLGHWIVRVANQGGAAADSSVLAVFAGPPSTTEPDLWFAIPGLVAGGTSAPMDIPEIPGSSDGRVVAVSGRGPDARPHNDTLVLPQWTPGPDYDEDGWVDVCDPCNAGATSQDSDQDGVPDACDACEGSDDAADYDGDGDPDGCDPCPLLAHVDSGESCSVDSPWTVDCADPPAWFDASPSACNGFRLSLEWLPCRECDSTDATTEAFVIHVVNTGDRPAPASTLEVFVGAPSDATRVGAVPVPALASGEAHNAGIDVLGPWFDDDRVVLARLTLSETTERECSAFGRADLLMSPGDHSRCVPPPRPACIRQDADESASMLSGTALLWVALAFRRRSAASG